MRKTSTKQIKVSFENGLIIQERKPTDTYIMALKEIVIMRIAKLKGYIIDGLPLIVKNKDTRKQLRNVDCSWYISTHMCTDAKKRIIERVARDLNLKIKVELVDID